MKLLLDSCVLIAASMSATGASRLVLDLGRFNAWEFLTTTYILAEVERRANRFSEEQHVQWQRVQTQLAVVPNVWTVDSLMVFPNQKDRPVLCSALKWADVLLTHDRAGFHSLLGRRFFRLWISEPREFIKEQQALGGLRIGP